MRVSLISLILSVFLIGCATNNYKNIPSKDIKVSRISSEQTYSDQHKKEEIKLDHDVGFVEPTDPMEEYIKYFSINKKIENTAYINADNLEMLSSPKIGAVINHIARGEQVFIVETKIGWANISVDQERPYWVDVKKLCYSKNCWINNKKNDDSLYSIRNIYSQSNKNQKIQLSNQSIQTQKQKTSSIYSRKQQNIISNRPTAQCSDGTLSYSQHRRGTCSHHGGVFKWY